MYFYLEGIITLHQKDSIVVDCHGVGYQVFVSHPEDYELGSVQKVYTAFYIREDALIDAIDRNDVLFLRKLPAIGPKAANQIILDLRGKLAYANKTKTGNKNMDEAMEGLKSFGFKQSEIDSAFSKISEQDLTTEEYIRKALNLLRRIWWKKKTVKEF